MILGLWQWVTRSSKKSLIRKRTDELVTGISDELDRIKLLRVGKIMKFNRLAAVIEEAEQKLVVEFKITRQAASNAVLKGIQDAGVSVTLEEQSPLAKE